MSLSTGDAIAIAVAVYNEFIEAKKRIPDKMKGYTYFGHLDMWKFRSWKDTGGISPPCEDCASKHNKIYLGNELRIQFPYLEIINYSLMIAGVHPHCRCILVYWGRAT